MRQIKFRGKDITTGEWQYGCLVNNLWGYTPHHSLAGQAVCEIIVCDTCDDYEDMQNKELNRTVDPKTVGQFTSLTDKNGKEIYEGDIVHPNIVHLGCDCEVVWHEFAWKLRTIPYDQNHLLRLEVWKGVEVIGNIYSHPELLNNL